MKNSHLSALFFILFFLLAIAINAQKTIYFFPGQGSDYRIFSKIELPEGYTARYLSYKTPCKKEKLDEFAFSFIDSIDTTKKYILVGQSLGGMICTELADTLRPEKIIIISSAKSRHELPFRYRFQKYIPVNRIVPRWIFKLGALMLQPIVEPDRKNEKETFKSMLKRKYPLYLKRTVNMIVNWERETYSPDIVHIHGTKDHTIPVRNIKCNYIINKGSHMMALTRGEEISELIQKIVH